MEECTPLKNSQAPSPTNKSIFSFLITQLTLKSKTEACGISCPKERQFIVCFCVHCLYCIGHLLGFPEMCTSGMVFQIGDFFGSFQLATVECVIWYMHFLPGCECVFFHFEGWISIFQQRPSKIIFLYLLSRVTFLLARFDLGTYLAPAFLPDSVWDDGCLALPEKQALVIPYKILVIC